MGRAPDRTGRQAVVERAECGTQFLIPFVAPSRGDVVPGAGKGVTRHPGHQGGAQKGGMDSSVHGYVSLFSRSWRLLGRVRGRRGKGCRPFESRTAVGPRPRGRAPGRPARHCGVPAAPGPVCARPGRSLTAAVGRHDEMDGVAACRHPRGTRLSAGRLPPRLPDVARKTQAEPILGSGPGQLIGMARNRSWANRHSWARQNRTVSTSAGGTGAAAAQPRRRTSGRCKRGTWPARLSSRTAGVPYAGGSANRIL